MQRAFLYGDLLFESMLGTHEGIPHIKKHYRRLLHGMQVLKLDCHSFSEAFFEKKCIQEIESFYKINVNSENCRVRFVIYRDGGGLYLPDSNAFNFIITVDALNVTQADSVVRAGVYESQKKAPGVLSNLKTGNALLYVMAKIWAKENNLDDALILNTENEIIEATSSNIFWKENKIWNTPPLKSGCVAGIGRELFIDKNEVLETPCFLNNLLKAEEVILTNALIPTRKLVFKGIL